MRASEEAGRASEAAGKASEAAGSATDALSLSRFFLALSFSLFFLPFLFLSASEAGPSKVCPSLPTSGAYHIIILFTAIP